jgi:RNA polymerase sigma factor (TIGR02999 family)
MDMTRPRRDDEVPFVIHEEPRPRHDPERRLTQGAAARVLRLPHAGGMLSFMSDVTRILSAIEQGDPSAAEQLLPLVYDELRKLAATRLAQEKAGQTLQATALVHEAYLRLVDGDRAQHWNSRGHFFGAAAEAMRRILVDNARRKQRPKHGGQRQRVDLDEAVQVADDRADELLSLHAALEKLEAESPEKAQLVKLRYFAGLSHQEAAEAMGISRTTADRHWAYAKVFLRCEMDDADKS